MLITAVISVKNEAHQILSCIESVKQLVDHIIIVDDQSSDNTVQLCVDNGCDVVSGVDSGNVELLNKQGFKLVKTGWILRIDADERITPKLAVELHRLSTDASISAISFARKNEMFGRLIEYGGWFEATQLRFFRADKWNQNWSGFIHTHPKINGKIVAIDKHNFHSIHLDYQNIRQFVQRSFHRYAFIEAKMLVKQGDKPSIVNMLYRPLKKSFGKYFIRRGFMDGKHGLVLALLLGVYELLIQLYIWDSYNNEILNFRLITGLEYTFSI